MGVSLHEELMPYGRTISEKDRLRDLRAIKELGFNTLRTAHYPHDEKLIEIADKVGMMILEEIPLYWRCDFANPSVQRLAARMMRDLIRRDFNHPSVILWSMGNEVPIENVTCRRFMHQLLRFVKKLDPSRIVTYVSSRMFHDPLRKELDLPCLNEYFGWYYFSEKNLNLILDMIHETDVSHPLLITEFGADAKYGFHSRSLQKSSEERQASILANSIETFNSKPYVAGWIIWLYRDFRSPLRTNKYQLGYNRKGIVSDKNELKVAAKAIRRISSATPKKRRFHILPKFGFPARLIELFVVGILFGFGQKLFAGKNLDKYYMRIPLPAKNRENERTSR
jgi:beta-glucuronidase